MQLYCLKSRQVIRQPSQSRVYDAHAFPACTALETDLSAWMKKTASSALGIHWQRVFWDLTRLSESWENIGWENIGKRLRKELGRCEEKVPKSSGWEAEGLRTGREKTWGAFRQDFRRWEKMRRGKWVERRWGSLKKSWEVRKGEKNWEASGRKIGKRWEESRRGKKSWEELIRDERNWEELNKVEKRWEELRRGWKRWEETRRLRSVEKSWEEVRMSGEKSSEKSWEDSRHHRNSWRQNFAFTFMGTYEQLPARNFRLPPCAGFTCIDKHCFSMLFTVHFSLVGNDLSYLNPKINTFSWLQSTIDMCGIINKK